MRREVAVESMAEAYLELLAARGIDYFFANGGTDFGPIIEAYAKRLASELPVPKPVTVPHEITAVAMAHFQSDMSLAGSTALTLQALVEAVRGEALDAARIRERDTRGQQSGEAQASVAGKSK